MPGMDGKEIFAQIHKVHPGMPTILMSGYNEQESTQDLVGRGLAAFLSKPFQIGELMTKIRASLKTGKT